MIQAVKFCAQYARQCRKCTQMVYFLLLRIPDTQRGKNGQVKLSELGLHPFNEDGTSHFATCEYADDFRKRNGIQKAEPAKIEQPGLFHNSPTTYPD